MNRIQVIKCFDVYSVMEFVEDMRDSLENKVGTLEYYNQKVFYNNSI